MLGIDIVDIERVKNIYQKHGLFFLRKVLDEKEIKALPAEGNANFFRTMGGLIASKEAVFKACSEDQLDWKEIYIRNIFHSPAVSIKRQGLKRNINLSLSVTGNIAIAQAVVR